VVLTCFVGVLIVLMGISFAMEFGGLRSFWSCFFRVDAQSCCVFFCGVVVWWVYRVAVGGCGIWFSSRVSSIRVGFGWYEGEWVGVCLARIVTTCQD